jgi:hypothetical protein
VFSVGFAKAKDKKDVFSLQMSARVAQRCVGGNVLLASCMLSGRHLEHASCAVLYGVEHSALCFSLLQSS